MFSNKHIHTVCNHAHIPAHAYLHVKIKHMHVKHMAALDVILNSLSTTVMAVINLEESKLLPKLNAFILLTLH